MIRLWIMKMLYPSLNIDTDTDRQNIWNVLEKHEKRLAKLEKK